MTRSEPTFPHQHHQGPVNVTGIAMNWLWLRSFEVLVSSKNAGIRQHSSNVITSQQCAQHCLYPQCLTLRKWRGQNREMTTPLQKTLF